jgi:hypothetical protein
MNITIDKADKYFSFYIRLRDGKCMRCGSLVRVNLQTGMPISHTTSHYFGRGKESTRFDPDNCVCLCMPCHRKWASDDREEYREFMIKRLGMRGFESLLVRSKRLVKKDRKMAFIQSKALLNNLYCELITVR